MSVLSLLNPFGWFGQSGNGIDSYRAKLTEGVPQNTGTLDPRGKIIGADAALQVGAFWACVRIIAETIATLPLQLFRHQGAGGRAAQPDHPLYGLLHDAPNADHSAMEFIEGLVAYVAVGGNAYVRKERIGSRLVALTLLKTPLMGVTRDRDGALVYRYRDPISGLAETYGDDDIMHVRGFGFGDDFGLSPLSYARRTLGISLAADEVTDVSFSNGMKMSGWFKYKGGNGILKPEQREQAHKKLVEPYVGAGNAAKVGIIEGDFDWISASMPMGDAQLLESRRFGVEDVCRWLGVPPILIGHAAQGQTMWGSGVEQIMLGWLAMGLRPYLVRIEQAIKRSLLTLADRTAGYYPEFNVDGLLRADSKARSENYSRLGQNGVLTRNEIRALENLPALPGGDVLTVQSNLVPIDMLGEIASLPRLKPIQPGEDLEQGAGGAGGHVDIRDVLAAKRFDPAQPRDERGWWISGGGGSGGAGQSDSWHAVRTTAKFIAVGVGLTAAAAAMVTLAPELFAVAGGAAAGAVALEAGGAAEAIGVAAQAGRLAQVTTLVRGAALQMYAAAGLTAASALLKDHLHLDAATIERWTEPLRNIVAGKAAAGPSETPITQDDFRRFAADVAAHARDALIAKLGGRLDDPGIAPCRAAIRDAYRAFVADTLA